MHRGFAYLVLIALLALLVFLWSTSGVATVGRRANLTDSTATASTTQPDSATPRFTSDHPGISSRATEEGLIIPVEGIEPEQLVDTYDEARSAGREHDAIDIIAPRGTRVLAADDGTILRFFNSNNGGLTIYQLASDKRTVFYYAHLDGYAPGLEEGQSVRQGQHIGYVGDTGNAVPGNHHLHFAIWTVQDTTNFWDGPSINPYPLLRRAQ